MDVSLVHNNYLKEIMREIAIHGHTEDLSLQLLAEFKYSSFITPGIFNEDGSVDYITLTSDDGIVAIPAFTDEEEYLKITGDIDDPNIEPIIFNLENYNLNESDNIDGIVINPESEYFTVPKDLVLQLIISDFDVSVQTSINPFTVDELKNIAYNHNNLSLYQFISDSNNEGNYDELFHEFSKSILLTTVSSNKELYGITNDVISIDESQGFSLWVQDNGEGLYAYLFTDMEKINSLQDLNRSVYAQVVNIDELASFVLYRDFDGIIINPGTNNYIIPRKVILSQIQSIKILCENPRLKRGIEYAFTLD